MGPGNPTCAARYYDTSAHTTTPKDQNLSDDHQRSCRRNTEAGTRSWVGPFTVQSRQGMPAERPRQARGARSAPSPCSHDRACRRNGPGRRAELVTTGHAGGTPRQACGARSAPLPCSHDRACRRNTQAGCVVTRRLAEAVQRTMG
ncbi:hypothetical protein Bbelb_411440 [Branchiostoma belcheri]|nr:hypothetical protein Bbelb_411440 [Branchiostoma belcheri]